MSKPNVSRVQSATEWTASVHTLHMSKPNVAGVQSAAEWTASVPFLHSLRSCFGFFAPLEMHGLQLLLLSFLLTAPPPR